jgi:hypothetical protein
MTDCQFVLPLTTARNVLESVEVEKRSIVLIDSLSKEYLRSVNGQMKGIHPQLQRSR